MVLSASILYSTFVQPVLSVAEASHTALFSNSFEQGVTIYSALTKGSHFQTATILSTTSNLSSPTWGQGARAL